MTPAISDHPVLKRIDAKALELAQVETHELYIRLESVLSEFGNIQVKTGETYVQVNPEYVLHPHSSHAWGTTALDAYQKKRAEFHRARLSDDLLKQFVLA